MEQTAFKTAAFGGFAKEDVMAYIEKTAREHTDAVDQLRRANNDLTQQLQTAQQALAENQSQLALLTRERDALRPDAQAYQRFSQRIGAIECEARERADTLERDAYARLSLAMESLQSQYQALAQTFDTSAKFALDELRKVEVSLTQLPRALDQVGVELNALRNDAEALENEKT